MDFSPLNYLHWILFCFAHKIRFNYFKCRNICVHLSLYSKLFGHQQHFVLLKWAWMIFPPPYIWSVDHSAQHGGFNLITLPLYSYNGKTFIHTSMSFWGWCKLLTLRKWWKKKLLRGQRLTRWHSWASWLHLSLPREAQFQQAPHYFKPCILYDVFLAAMILGSQL